MHKLAFFLPALLWLSCFVNDASGKGVIVSLPGRSVQLRGEVADFGYQFDQLISHPANLVLAPEEDPYLCSYPASLENATLREEASTTPIALFVSRGECSFEQKAQVALALQKNITQNIRYVIIYNNDRENPSQLIRMGGIDLELPTLGFLAVSTRAGSYTMSSVLYYAEATQRDPHLGANETDWEYPIEIAQYRSYSRGGTGANTFYLLRFVLFTLLILAPCLRAAYLWWNGGGRVEFRRNERGRVTGLQYVRPIPYWFAPSAQSPERQERSRLLTEQQVRDLPEISFVKPPHDENDDFTDDASSESSAEPTESGEAMAEPDIVVEPTISVDNNNDEDNGQATQGESRDDNEASPSQEPLDGDPNALTTSCTTCSICIDDFEDGERIRLLPKCRHAFHTDCVMPWLTERQGCCPLCKRSVLGPDDDGSEDGANNDVEQGVNHQSQAAEPEQVVATQDQVASVESDTQEHAAGTEDRSGDSPVANQGQTFEAGQAVGVGQDQGTPVERGAQGQATTTETTSGYPPV